jgi:hypothetical protein
LIHFFFICEFCISMSNGLITNPSVYSVPSSIKTSEDDFNDLAKGGDFLGRLQLFTKGEAINKRLIAPGQYGIPISADKVQVLGDAVDLLVLARRVKAMDMSDRNAIITNYDRNSDVFKGIMERSEGEDSGCMYGPSFLVIERTTGKFLEFFCGSGSSRREAGNLYPFVPAEAKGNEGEEGYEPARGPGYVTLKANIAKSKNGKFSWHVPVVLPCSTPFAKLPSLEKQLEEIRKFLNPKSDEVEESKETNRRAR